MEILAIDTLRGQRGVFEAKPDERAALYRERVTEPLQPFWETMQRMMPPGRQPPDFVQAIGLYDPAGDAEEALRALDRLEKAGSWDACREAVDRAVRALRPAERGVALDKLLFAVALGDPARLKPVHGFTGFGGNPGQVIVLVWPSDYNVPRLPSIAAHEFHHNVRLTFEPWGPETTVGQYIVLEGLAEAFAAELYGEDMLGPWVSALTDEQHEEVRPRFREALAVQGFNEIRGYMFGDPAGDFPNPGYEKKGVPPYAGYAVGYRVVSDYLRRSGKTAAEATYVPWRDIVAESRYFER
ncbi:DUF2268 domain-containing protein [Paenibacillus flagellatus]|uniref:DUF2268 domain-containing protein n=1 Tax=Paenibacillus flagellatus TaxID=2211139 RepID=A0A2V5KC93_9BACL|nr:DUF2268 domain-containing putative Zn-dependent protease [Paenibacillus flagellatus]PYI57108.1 hypothetical protein DLM86_01290 [Paenibacillus flagellatus]